MKEQFPLNGKLKIKKKIISFLNYYLFRNGIDLGIAFDNVPCGRGIAYFPAISLSQNERVKINFGSTPFRHPSLNYLPIDEKPQLFIEQADFLLNILEQLIYLGKCQKFNGINKTTNSLKVIY
jgi:Kip1 ubiquitination-promoting complex protein 1